MKYEDCEGLPGCRDAVRKSQKEPSLLSKAINLVKGTAEHVVSGAENVSKEEFKKRIDICNSCIHFVGKKEICGICGCYMSVKAKWKTSECPKDKW